MATLADLTARREALLQIRAAGTREIDYGDKRIVYRSDDEIAAAIRDLDLQISQATASNRVSSVYITSSKGV